MKSDVAADVDVWIVFYDEIADQTCTVLRALLSDVERQQQSRFYFADDRKRYLVTRATVRLVLSRYWPLAPREWAFTTNEYGRPEIENPSSEPGYPRFNISHTRHVIALAVTRGRELGVDVENVRARDVSLGIAAHFFAPDEVAALNRVEPHRQQERFFEYWTFKESYIKARGMGLSLPLDRFSFQFPNERGVRITIQPELDDDASRWCFWQFRPRPHYLLAVCAERRDAVPRLTIRKLVPTHTEEVLNLEAFRTSEGIRGALAEVF